MRGRAFVVRKFRTSSGQVRTKPGHDAPIEDERDGSQRFPTADTSRNSFWVALLTFGEGWHNNHHAHPQSSRHGLAWYEFDPNWYGICALQVMGLASDVKARKLETIDSMSVPQSR